MTFRTWLAAFLTLPFLGCVASGDRNEACVVPLVADGVFVGRIYVPAAADPAEREAAAHLATWIRRVTGATPEVAREPAGESGPGLYVGATRAAAARGVTPPSSPSGETAVRAGFAGGVVCLRGATPTATRLAAGVFAREVLGVEFLAPGLTGADWTPRRDIVVRGESVWRPAYAWRAITLGDMPEEREWALDNGFGALPAMNHNLYTIFDDELYAKAPELFPLVDGRRLAPSGLGGYAAQPNLAHPDAPGIAANAVANRLRSHPETTSFSLCINDTCTWDESPVSMAIFSPERWFRNRRNRTDYVFRFMNGTAATLDAQGLPWRPSSDAPGVFLTAYAYYECEAPPSFRLHPRVFPILTADRSEWRDATFEAEDRGVISAWAKAGCAAFGIYDYYYGREMVMPRIFFREQAASVRHAAREGAVLFYCEMNPDWGFDAPKAWLTGRLTEAPEADAEALLREYFDRAYGAAATPMRRFYSVIERCWRERSQPPRWIRFYREESAAALFPRETRRELSRCIDEAITSLPAPVSGRDGERELHRRCRVLATALAWARADAFADWYEARAALDALPVSGEFDGVARVREAYARCERLRRSYETACRRWATSRLNPGTPFDPDLVFGAQAAGVAALKCGGLVPDNPFVDAASIYVLSPYDVVESLWSESFDAAGFQKPPGADGRPAVREVNLPNPPSYAKVMLGEHTRFGPDASRAFEGATSLLVAATDQAGIVRRFKVRPGETIGATVRYSGRITAGEHVAVYLNFLTASGSRSGRVLRGVAFPGGDDAWRSLAVVGVVPQDAIYADVTLRVTSQDPGDAVWFDDLRVRRMPAP